MFLVGYFNERAKKLTIFDIKLAQAAAMCLILIVAKLVPWILEISVWWFVGLVVLFAIRPVYAFFLKR
jgi:hypothetical protein